MGNHYLYQLILLLTEKKNKLAAKQWEKPGNLVILYQTCEDPKKDSLADTAEKAGSTSGSIRNEIKALLDCKIYEKENILVISDNLENCEQARTSGFAVLPLWSGGTDDEAIWRYPFVTDSFESMTEDFLEEVFCRQKNLPLTIALTERLILRETVSQDLPQLFAIYHEERENPYIQPLFGFKPDCLFSDFEKERYQNGLEDYIHCQYHFFEYGMWTVCLRLAPETVIGRIGLEQDESGNVTLGFLIAHRFRGLGYAEEGCKAAIKYAKEHDIKKICLVTDRKNKPAIALAERLGFAVPVGQEPAGSVPEEQGAEHEMTCVHAKLRIE